ncbi:hypothetical protein diail_3509 [Diaporthe ilicicola]|nr:hypothetical protein diail_3509 [Diaporthe ilicicola]
MSDHVPKTDQANAGHTDTTGIKLKPVTGAVKLRLEAAEAAVANSTAGDNVSDTSREMDLTFYDNNGNIETADPDGDITMEDHSMQPIEHGGDASSSSEESVSADTSFTTISDNAANCDGDIAAQSIEQDVAASSPIQELVPDDTQITDADGASNKRFTAVSDGHTESP